MDHIGLFIFNFIGPLRSKETMTLIVKVCFKFMLKIEIAIQERTESSTKVYQTSRIANRLRLVCCKRSWLLRLLEWIVTLNFPYIYRIKYCRGKMVKQKMLMRALEMVPQESQKVWGNYPTMKNPHHFLSLPPHPPSMPFLYPSCCLVRFSGRLSKINRQGIPVWKGYCVHQVHVTKYEVEIPS